MENLRGIEDLPELQSRVRSFLASKGPGVFFVFCPFDSGIEDFLLDVLKEVAEGYETLSLQIWPGSATSYLDKMRHKPSSVFYCHDSFSNVLARKGVKDIVQGLSDRTKPEAVFTVKDKDKTLSSFSFSGKFVVHVTTEEYFRMKLPDFPGVTLFWSPKDALALARSRRVPYSEELAVSIETIDELLATLGKESEKFLDLHLGGVLQQQCLKRAFREYGKEKDLTRIFRDLRIENDMTTLPGVYSE